MGIFTSNTGAYTSTLDFNQGAGFAPALESANFVALSIEAVAENQNNYNKIMKAIGVNELSYFEENGTEIVYEAGGLGGFLGKIKQMFQKLWDKIKEIFHKFFAWLDSFTKGNKEFAKKYRKEAIMRWDKLEDTWGIKGYKFDFKGNVAWDNNTLGTTAILNEISPDSAKYVTSPLTNKDKTGAELDDFAKPFKEDDINDKLRAKVAKVFGITQAALSESEFTSEIKEKLYGSESPESLDKSDIAKFFGTVQEMCNALEGSEGSNSPKKTAEDAFKTFKKQLDDDIKTIETAEKDITKAKDYKVTEKDENNANKEVDRISNITSLVSSGFTTVKNFREYCIQANGYHLQAIKDSVAQIKRIVTSIITSGKIKNESADLYSGYSESATSMGFLDSVVLK